MQIQAINFRQNPPTEKVSEPKSLSEKHRKEHDQAKVVLSLGALALLGIAVVAINRSRASKIDAKGEEIMKKITPEPPKTDEFEVEKKEIASILPDLAQEDNLHLAKLRKLFKLNKEDPKYGLKPSVIIVTGNNPNRIEQMIAKLPEITSTRMTNIVMTPENPLIEVQNAVKQSTGEKTLIHCGSLDEILNTNPFDDKPNVIADYKGFLDNCAKNDAITAVFSSKALTETAEGQNAHKNHGYIINTDEKILDINLSDLVDDFTSHQDHDAIKIETPKEPLIGDDTLLDVATDVASFEISDHLFDNIF